MFLKIAASLSLINIGLLAASLRYETTTVHFEGQYTPGLQFAIDVFAPVGGPLFAYASDIGTGDVPSAWVTGYLPLVPAGGKFDAAIVSFTNLDSDLPSFELFNVNPIVEDCAGTPCPFSKSQVSLGFKTHFVGTLSSGMQYLGNFDALFGDPPPSFLTFDPSFVGKEVGIALQVVYEPHEHPQVSNWGYNSVTRYVSSPDPWKWSFDAQFTTAYTVPEPSALALCAVGLTTLVLTSRFHFKR